MADIGAGAIDSLRKGVTGVVSQAGESSYDDAVNIWNGAITRRPAVVASCTSSSDVAGAWPSRNSMDSRCRFAVADTTMPASHFATAAS